MLKNIISKALVLLAVIALPASAITDKFVEGKHYTELNEAKTKKPEIKEYFSYYCGACKGFEGIIPDLMASLPSNTKLKKVHVDFMGASSQEVQYLMAQALLVAKKSKLDKKFSTAMFNHLQVKRKKVEDLDDIKAVYVSVGGDGDRFDKGMKNFSVVSKAKRDKKIQDELSNKRVLTSVPTFVVNGKYVIHAKELDRDDYINDYKKIMAYLLTK
jgi:thiol:disulfide interchange protein DsbA